MKFGLFTPDSPYWLETINKMSYDFYHLPEYVALSARYEKGQAYAFIAQEGLDIIFFPFITRPVTLACGGTRDPVYYDAISPYGYASPLLRASRDVVDEFYQSAINSFFEELKKKNVVSVFLRLHPLLTDYTFFNHYGHLVCHGNTVSIDLNLSEQEIWRQTRRNHRDGIKQAKEMGYSTLVDYEWKYWDKFLEIYYETMNRNRAEQYYYFSPSYFEELRHSMKNYLHLGVVLSQGEVASAGLFSEMNGVVQYHFSATADKHLKWASSKSLLYFMTLWEKQRGNRVLHIGGGCGGTDDALFRFKAGFSKNRHPFYTWRFITNPKVYSELISDWEHQNVEKADDLCGYFPAYRKHIFGIVLLCIAHCWLY